MAGRAATTRAAAGDYALSIGLTDMPAPRAWTWLSLPEVARLESGHTPSREHPEYWDGDVPWVGIPDAREHHGSTILDTRQRITQAGLDNSAARRLPPGTVCLSRTASIGYVTVLGREMATSQDFVNWICSRALDPEFLKWLFVSEKAALLRFGTGSTHKTIYYPEVKAFRVCLPPLAEQRRIVAKIDALTARSRTAREALEQVPPLLERFRQSVLAAAFRGDLTAEWRRQHPDVEPASVLLERIRAERRRAWEEAELAAMRAKGKEPMNDKWKAGFEEPATVDTGTLPELPNGWCWASLEALTNPVRTIRYGIVLPGPEFPGGVRYVKVKHMKGDVIDTSDLPRTDPSIHAKYARAALGRGDLLLSIRGTFGGIAPVPDELEGANITQDSARIAPMPGVRREFLAAMLRSPFGQAYFKKSAKGVAVQGLNIGDIRPMPIPLAPEAEQAAVASAVERAQEMLSRLRAAAASATTRIGVLDQSILAKAFRGELVPQDPNDEPASVLLDRIRAEREAAGASGGRRGRRARASEAEPSDTEDEPDDEPAAARTTGTNGNGSTLHAVLGALKREALHRIADAEGVELADRRSLDAAREGVIEGGVTLEAALEHLDRDELKAVCRALGLEDRGRAKGVLRARVLAAGA